MIKVMTFADDMNLIAVTPQGLQALIDHSTAYLLQCGMKINQAKSHTVSIVGFSDICLEGVPPSKNLPPHGPEASYHQLVK